MAGSRSYGQGRPLRPPQAQLGGALGGPAGQRSIRISWTSVNSTFRPRARRPPSRKYTPQASAAIGGRAAVRGPQAAISANPSTKYYHFKKGITWINAANSQLAGIGQMVVPGAPRDSLFILDTLLNLDGGVKPEMAATGHPDRAPPPPHPTIRPHAKKGNTGPDPDPQGLAVRAEW